MTAEDLSNFAKRTLLPSILFAIIACSISCIRTDHSILHLGVFFGLVSSVGTIAVLLLVQLSVAYCTRERMVRDLDRQLERKMDNWRGIAAATMIVFSLSLILSGTLDLIL